MRRKYPFGYHQARQLFPVLAAIAPLAFAAVAACDPDLNITKAGDGGSDAPAVGTGDGGGAVGSDGGNDGGGSDAGGDSGSFTPAHVIDGTNDFKASEKFPTTSLATGYEGYVTWDAKNVYFGMSGPDVGANDPNKWVMVYFGTDAPGTTTGIDYGGQQQATLPFPAFLHVRWKTAIGASAYSSIERYTNAWAKEISVPTVQAQGTFMEMAIPRTLLGGATKLKVHMTMLIEGGGNDWTYAGVPSTSFPDGKNPSFTKYLEFDLADTAKAPGSYTPKT